MSEWNEIAGIDLGGRKAAISLYRNGKLFWVRDLEIRKNKRHQELQELGHWVADSIRFVPLIFIEEPLIGRGTRASLQVVQALGAVLSHMRVYQEIHLVPVSSWKKEVVGKGNADKEFVRNWLQSSHPAYADACGSNQDRIDAVCIGQYGVQVSDRAQHLGDL